MKMLYCAPYVSPLMRQPTPTESRVREIAIGLKSADDACLAEAARCMAPLVPPFARLVPIPSSSGSTHANLMLCRCIAAKRCDTVVCDIIERVVPLESSYQRRHRGCPGHPVEAHKFRLNTPLSIGAARPVIFVDNVITSGATMTAARKALGTGTALAFAKCDSEVIYPVSDRQCVCA